MEPASPQRRKEPRIPREARVVLLAMDLPEITGRLVDYSPSGFRATHSCRALSPGQTVDFSHPFAQGIARVVWTRIEGDRVESGFFITRSGPR